MKSIANERLVEMVTSALERTCFMISDPSDAETVSGSGFDLTRSARIAYSGSGAGYVLVSASDGFLEELASSLLGCEPEEVDLDVDGRDAICELANIMGGSVTLELGGDTSEYRLGLPQETDGTGSNGGTDIYVESMAGALRVCWMPDDGVDSQAA